MKVAVTRDRLDGQTFKTFDGISNGTCKKCANEEQHHTEEAKICPVRPIMSIRLILSENDGD